MPSPGQPIPNCNSQSKQRLDPSIITEYAQIFVYFHFVYSLVCYFLLGKKRLNPADFLGICFV